MNYRHKHFLYFLIALVIIVGRYALFDERGKEPQQPAGSAVEQSEAAETLLISVAASTSDAVHEIVKLFEKQTSINVKINTGASSQLANQILSGAPVDLFLSANVRWADEVEKAGLAAKRVDLLTTELCLITPQNNPAQVQSLEDLVSDRVKFVALAGEAVPAGIYAQQALESQQLWERLQQQNKVVRGQDVRNTLRHVERGDAEAGIVYLSDTQVADVHVAQRLNPDWHEKIVYVLMSLNRNESADQEKLFEFFQSADADQIFEKFGFQQLSAVP